MKKILSILGLIAVLGMTTPAFAAPSGHGGSGYHGGGPYGGGQRIHAGAHHSPHMAPQHHGGVMVHSGYPRHSHWHGYRYGYWGSSWCDYRLGWCDSYYYPPCRPHAGVYFPIGSAGVSVRF